MKSSLLDVEGHELVAVAKELGASEPDMQKAFNRALARTVRTLRKDARIGLRQNLGLRNAKVLRRRLRGLSAKRLKNGGADMWFGMNDIPVSNFKGRPRQSPRGAAFRGVQFDHGFVRVGAAGKRTILKRVGGSRSRLTEAKMPVHEQMEDYIDEEIFDPALDIFWRYFRADLRARTVYGVG